MIPVRSNIATLTARRQLTERELRDLPDAALRLLGYFRLRHAIGETFQFHPTEAVELQLLPNWPRSRYARALADLERHRVVEVLQRHNPQRQAILRLR